MILNVFWNRFAIELHPSVHFTNIICMWHCLPHCTHSQSPPNDLYIYIYRSPKQIHKSIYNIYCYIYDPNFLYFVLQYVTFNTLLLIFIHILIYLFHFRYFYYLLLIVKIQLGSSRSFLLLTVQWSKARVHYPEKKSSRRQ